MATLLQLAVVMRQRGAAVPRNLEKAKRDVFMACDVVTVEGTPVDKGPARSNWIASRGTPTTEVIEAYAPGNKLGRGETANARAAIAQAFLVASQSKEGEALCLSNNVHYIGLLNDGSSKQAPASFVELGIQAAVAVIPGVDILKI